MNFVFFLLIIVSIAFSNTNRITTSDGITCESTTNEPYEVESYVESVQSDLDGEYTSDYEKVDNNSVLLGLKFVYKFGGQKPLDCNKLYTLELRKKVAKVKELEAKIKALESVNKINWNSVNEK